jgi:orotate phosphoribosyltransferase
MICGDNMELTNIFERENVIKRGHFLLASKRHSDVYINKNMITTTAELFNIVVIRLMCRVIEFAPYKIVTGPATAGAILASAVAIRENKGLVYPEKVQVNNQTTMKFQRGYDKVIEGKSILLIEDIITTGNSVQQTINAIEECNGNIVGILAIWNRSGWEPEKYEIRSLINDHVMSWDKNECPLCKNNINLTDPKTGETLWD